MANNNNNFTLIQSYPVFEPNQVLTDNQLNGVVEYLEQQDRLTRVCILGMGIICGLEAEWKEMDGEQGLYISEGHGITSEGYLVKMKSELLTHYLLRDVSSAWFGVENGEGVPSLFANVLDLVDADKSGAVPLDKTHLFGRVLALVVECKKDDNDELCGNDCDEKGKSLNFNVHKMLLTREQADLILKESYQLQDVGEEGVFSSLGDAFYYRFFAEHPYIERFGYKKDGNGNTTVKLTNIKKYGDLLFAYQHLLKPMSARIDDALKSVHKVFSPVFTPGLAADTGLSIDAVLKDKIESGSYHPFEVQYIYDYLCDLVHAYLELLDTVSDLVADCPADMHRFPKHLWLRKFTEEGAPEMGQFTVYRTPYTQPPLYNGNRSRLAEVRTLYVRLSKLVTAYQIPGFIENILTKVTPSKNEEVPLSHRAVPYYYNPAADLFNYWHPRRQRIRKNIEVYGYNSPGATPYNDPLAYQMQGSNFFRIEGHIGKDKDTAFNEVEKIRKDYNLPFEVMLLKIGTVYDDPIRIICEDFECQMKEYQERYARMRETYRQEVLREVENVDPGSILQTGPANTILFGKIDTSGTAKRGASVFTDEIKVQVDQTLKEKLPEQIRYFSNENFEGLQAQLNKIPSLAIAAPAFQELKDCYDQINERLQEVIKLHLFHNFADAHPGMEHKGGVPVGGTFIMAYVDLEEVAEEIKAFNLPSLLFAQMQYTGNIVVADFFIPYTCVSCCPPICFVVPKPVPILTVTPRIFCSDDTDANELEVIAYPGGGIIYGLKAGYEFKDGKHWFTPANVKPEDIDQDGNVTLIYNIDGAEAKVLLALVDPPDASFDMLFNNQSVLEICRNQGPVSLVPKGLDGIFQASAGDDPQPDSIDNEKNEFLPDQLSVPVNQPVEVKITHSVFDEESACKKGEITRTIKVLPVPLAGFTMEGPDSLPDVCVDIKSVNLKPDVQAGKSTFKALRIDANGNEVEVPGAVSGTQFLPGAFKAILKQSNNIKVFIVHRKESPDNPCAGTERKELLVWQMPPAPKFSLPEQICHNAPPLNLKGDPSGGTFYFKQTDSTGPGTELEGGIFDPSTVQGQLPTDVFIRYEIKNGPCTATSGFRAVRVMPVPEAGFNAEFIPSESQQVVLVRLNNIKAVDKGKYSWTSVPEPPVPIGVREDNNDFIVEYPVGMAGTGDIKISLKTESSGCESKVVSKTVRPVIDLFELKEISKDDDVLVEVSSRTLQDGALIPASNLEGNLFNIRAFPLPKLVKSVKFKLTGPVNFPPAGDDGISTKNLPGFDMVENDALPVTAGTYTLEATPVSIMNLTGVTKKITFTIVADADGGGTDSDIVVRSVPAAPSDEALVFMRRRDGSYRSALRELGTDTGLAQTEGYIKTEGFMNFQNGQDAFNKRFEQAMDALLNDARKAKKGSPRRNKLLELMSIATRHFMDRQVVASVNEAPQDVLDVLTEQMEAMKRLGLDAKALKKDWAGSKLKKQLSAPAVDAFNKLLK